MKTLLTVLIGLLLIPNVSVAAELTIQQSNAILGVLSAFGADRATIEAIRAILMPNRVVSGASQAETITYAPVVPTCVETPILALSLATTTSGEMVLVRPKATYSTGCPLKAGLSYSYKIRGGNSSWQGYRNDHGIVDRTNGTLSETEWTYVPLGVYPESKNSPVVFTMTVGDTTQQVIQ